MTISLLDGEKRLRRRGPALTPDARAFGLRRQVVMTSVGRVVVRAGAVTGDTATILIHGAAGSWTTWTPLLDAAERAGHPLTNVVAIDLPGWGESAARADLVSVAQMSDVVCEVAEALGYARWSVVGHSLGGLLALDIAARTPERTDAVLLISPSGPAMIEAIRHPVRGALTLPWFAGMLLAMRLLAGMGPAGSALVRALHRVGMLGGLSAPLFAEPAHVHHTVIDALAAEVRARAFVDAARAAAGYDESIWAEITCPVRALRGERDVFVSDTDRAELARIIRDFDQSTVRAAGHFAAVEQPDVVLGALRALTWTQQAAVLV